MSNRIDLEKISTDGLRIKGIGEQSPSNYRFDRALLRSAWEAFWSSSRNSRSSRQSYRESKNKTLSMQEQIDICTRYDTSAESAIHENFRPAGRSVDP